MGSGSPLCCTATQLGTFSLTAQFPSSNAVLATVQTHTEVLQSLLICC